MNKVLTVSIAAYHVEKYLAECLDSFAVPELAEDLEVLIINDGSGEGINAIARQYETKYPDIFRLIDKENGGHGSTVNRGIEEASGTYFKTVDGDDWVQREGLLELIQYLRHSETDLVVTDYQCFDDTSGKIIAENHNEFVGKIYRKEYRWEDISDKVYINMHAATFRTSLLNEMKWRLDEHCYYVDAEYILYPVPFLQTVIFLEKSVYMYRQGMTTQSMDIRNMQKNCRHHETVLNHLLDFFDECQEGLSAAKRRYIAKGIARILTSQIKIYLSFPADSERKRQISELDSKIKIEYPEVYYNVTNGAVKMLRFSKYRLYKWASAACRKSYHCEEGECK